MEHNAPWPDLLKALDEYNYCTYTLKVTAHESSHQSNIV
jgi:hypothetical protein